jgi:glycosyltransferase involved in cell wall biosynthesis
VRLLIVSDMSHQLDGDGRVVGWGPTVREIEHLATVFDEIVHVAPLHDGLPSATALRYDSGRVRLRPVRAAGGAGIVAKAGIVWRIPAWVTAIQSELRRADAVHIRCPANISLIALLVLALSRRPRPRWVKYAGNWSPATNEAASYRLQRWMLRRNVCRAAVTVNGVWPAQSAHVHAFDNPTLTDEELRTAAQAAADKALDGELRIVFAGRLEEAKGAGRVLDIAERLADSRVPFHLDLAGDGPDRPRYEMLVAERQLAKCVTFHGWLDRAGLDRIYAQAHIILLPTTASEGFPKVLAEGMAHGAVPLAGDISAIGQVLTEAGTGAVLLSTDVDAFVAALVERADVRRWHRESTAAVRAAPRFAYDRYLDDVRSMLLPARHEVEAPARVGVFGPHLGGHKDTVVSQGEILVGLLSDAGYEVHHASARPRRLLRAIDTAATLLRAPALDVVMISVFSGPGFAMAEMTTALAAIRGVPVVLVLHGGNLPSFAARHPRRVGRLLVRAHVVVAPSPFLARELGWLRGDIIVVPNALPLREYPTRTRASLQPRLLWMRTFEPLYRPDMALEVLAILLQSDPSVTLTLAGQDAGLLEPTQRRAAQLGVAHAVAFPGFLGPKQKQRALDEHDVFLSTSAVDNAPVGVLEAARSGLVIVAADTGGVRDVLVDGESGLLVRDGDAPAMADAVRKVLDDATLTATLSNGARAVGAGSTQECVASAWEEIIRRAH